MAWELTSYIVNPDDEQILMAHQFFGLTQSVCKSTYAEHASHCSYFKAAIAEGRVANKWEEIPDDDLPEADTGDNGDPD